MDERIHEDRRIFHRFKANMDLQYEFLELEIRGKGVLQDIGAGGIGFITDKRVHLFAPIAFKIEIPHNKDVFYFTGEVVWVRRVDFNTYRAGIRFNSPCLIGVWKVLNGLQQHVKEAAAVEPGAEPHLSVVSVSPEEGVLKKLIGTFSFLRLKLTHILS